MKVIQFIMLFTAYLSFGQNQTKENFVLENNQVYWQKVFPRENIQEDSLKSLFETIVLSKFKYSKLDEKQSWLSFDVADDAIDFKKYGGGNFSTGIFAKQAHLYRVVAEFKDNRYRVTISQIQNIDDKVNAVNEPFEEAVTKRGEAFYNSKVAEKGLAIMNTYFTEKFTIPRVYKKKESDW